MRHINHLLLILSFFSFSCSNKNDGAVHQSSVKKKKIVVSTFEDGAIKMECDCYKKEGEEELADGECIYYYPSGQIKLIGEWKNGLMEGEQKAYYETGEVKLISHYKHGVREGEQIEYYLSGKVKSRMEVKNDIGNGESKDYYRSGNLYEQCTVIDGKGEGKFYIYYDKSTSPNLKIEGNYKSGKRAGSIKFYNEDGTLKEIKEYPINP